MDWQTIAVAIVVGAAIWYLIRRLRPRRRPAQTFVPLSDVKRRADRCH